jgi:hypothetical protein
MRRTRQVLQLHFGVHASARVIAREVGVGRTTVQDYLARAIRRGPGWPLAADPTDDAMEQLPFPAPSHKLGARHYPEPDWAALVREMKRPGVSLSILREEYNAVHPQGYRHSRFCELYGAFERRLSPTMRQTHVAGHKAFVDYSGKKVPIIDPLTGETNAAPRPRTGTFGYARQSSPAGSVSNSPRRKSGATRRALQQRSPPTRSLPECGCAVRSRGRRLTLKSRRYRWRGLISAIAFGSFRLQFVLGPRISGLPSGSSIGDDYHHHDHHYGLFKQRV